MRVKCTAKNGLACEEEWEGTKGWRFGTGAEGAEESAGAVGLRRVR
jgi:hypothetical protein